MNTKITINALYSFPGFRARSRLKGILGNSPARIISLQRRQKKQYVPHAGRPPEVSTTGGFIGFVTWTPAEQGYTWNSNIGGWGVGGVGV